jgi:hypothetical protein
VNLGRNGKTLGVLAESERSQPLCNTSHGEPCARRCNNSTNMTGEDVSRAVPGGRQRRASRQNSRLQECTHPASSLGAMGPLTARIGVTHAWASSPQRQMPSMAIWATRS